VDSHTSAYVMNENATPDSDKCSNWLSTVATPLQQKDLFECRHNIISLYYWV